MLKYRNDHFKEVVHNEWIIDQNKAGMTSMDPSQIQKWKQELKINGSYR